MDKEHLKTMQMQQTSEWKKVNELLKADLANVHIDVRQFTMPTGKPIIHAFQELNQHTLPRFSSSTQQALMELARGYSRSSKNTDTFVITRIEAPAKNCLGLMVDKERLFIVSLAKRPGLRTFVSSLEKHYKSNPTTSHLYGFLGVAWPPSPAPNIYVVATIPIEDRPIVEEIAKASQMLLSDALPRDVAMDPGGVLRVAVYPMQDKKYVVYLVNETGSVAYQGPQASEELHRIESMLLPDSPPEAE